MAIGDRFEIKMLVIIDLINNLFGVQKVYGAI